MDSEPIVRSGYWWFPGEEDKQPGELRIESGKRPRLTLTKPSSSFAEDYGLHYKEANKVYPLIYGRTTNGPVTLCNAIVVQVRSSATGGPSRKEFEGEYALEDMFLPSLDGRHIKRAEIIYTSLSEWVSSNGFSFKTYGRFGNFDMRYRIPPKRRFKVTDDLWITLAVRHPWPPWVEERVHHIEESPFVILSTRRPESVEFYREQILKLRDFLSFACLDVCRHEAVSLQGNFGWRTDHAGRHYPKAQLFDGQIRKEQSIPQTLKRTELLFSDSDAEDLEAILRGWFRRADEIEPARVLYRAAIGPGQYTETRFLFLCQAIESYHRSRGDDLYMEQDEYDDKVLPILQGAIPSSLDEGHKASLRSRLRFGNEIALWKRVRDLYRACANESFDGLFGKDFYVRVIDARNTLIHKGTSKEFGEKHRPYMHRYVSFLRMLLELSVARDCGFGRQQISALADRRTNQIRAGIKR